MKWTMILLVVMLVALGCADATGSDAESAYGPNYYYDEVHQVSCYTGSYEGSPGRSIFCFKSLGRASEPARWIGEFSDARR